MGISYKIPDILSNILPMRDTCRPMNYSRLNTNSKNQKEAGPATSTNTKKAASSSLNRNPNTLGRNTWTGIYLDRNLNSYDTLYPTQNICRSRHKLLIRETSTGMLVPNTSVRANESQKPYFAENGPFRFLTIRGDAIHRI